MKPPFEPLKVEYNPSLDILTVEGIAYHGYVFRSLGLSPLRADEVFRVVKREDGIVTLQSYRGPEVERLMNDNTGKLYIERIPVPGTVDKTEPRCCIGIGNGMTRDATWDEVLAVYPGLGQE